MILSKHRSPSRKCRSVVLQLIALACVAVPVIAAAPTPADRADAILRRAMADRKIPGLQAAVVMDGKVVFSRSYGVANLQTPVPVLPTTLFTLNSVTKAFTGVAVMREVERGRLDLSAPIARYLDNIPASWGKVTVRQLLGQISGLPDIDARDSDFIGVANEDKARALTQPVHLPGVKDVYCQTNLVLVQRIVDRLESRPLDSPIIGDELAKAGMVETSFGDSRDVIVGKSQPYRLMNAEHGIHTQFERFGPMMHADAGLNSTGNDMARWMISVLNGPHKASRSSP